MTITHCCLSDLHASTRRNASASRTMNPSFPARAPPIAKAAKASGARESVWAAGRLLSSSNGNPTCGSSTIAFAHFLSWTCCSGDSAFTSSIKKWIVWSSLAWILRPSNTRSSSSRLATDGACTIRRNCSRHARATKNSWKERCPKNITSWPSLRPRCVVSTQAKDTWLNCASSTVPPIASRMSVFASFKVSSRWPVSCPRRCISSAIRPRIHSIASSRVGFSLCWVVFQWSCR